MKKIKKAFTMIELIFIIVIVGILAAAVIPRIERNTLLEAANQVVSHIRYTQHLAMLDNKYDFNDPQWYRERWQIFFSCNNAGAKNVCSYTVFSDNSGGNSGNPDANEIATDPQNPSKLLTGGFGGTVPHTNARANPNLRIGEKFGVTNVQFTGGCAGGQRVAFDEKGRPYGVITNAANHVDRRLVQDCNITLLDGAGVNNTAIITIHRETGYVELVQFPRL